MCVVTVSLAVRVRVSPLPEQDTAEQQLEGNMILSSGTVLVMCVKFEVYLSLFHKGMKHGTVVQFGALSTFGYGAIAKESSHLTLCYS